ncbi:WbbJ Acetyltransferase (isoleucine patch superfamily) [uncultured Caudovirales phage]|uniref:Chloramphenicol acetyltransferase n=1 Tax=uncultured Caudovirales phage TaxID=2100421 RepID=A0A6J5M8K4_9CAUD|nr:WbbJ Acetyltransferase (isoleucine patch superfamily) [uncultured Caudovirales phage]
MSFLKQSDLEKLGFKSLGKNVLLSNKASIYNAKNISIGDNSRIDDFSILSAGDGGINIGKNVHIACFSAIIGRGMVIMDDFSGLSSRVSVYSSSDDYSGEYMTNPCIPNDFTNTIHKDVIIGKHSVIGASSIVLPGVHIGNYSAVGAMSLVKDNVGEFEIVAGVPAKKMKDRKRQILEVELKYLQYITNEK